MPRINFWHREMEQLAKRLLRAGKPFHDVKRQTKCNMLWIETVNDWLPSGIYDRI